MTNTAVDYARTQADGADNIAPTALQGQQAWQYAQSDNFFSPEEHAAVLRRELEPYRAQIEARLTEVGYPPEQLARYPLVEQALFSGQPTQPIAILVAPDTLLKGSLRIVMTTDGPDIRITPLQTSLNIPDEIGGIRLSRAEQQQLAEEGSLPKPFLIPDKGEYIPTYLRIDPRTNAVELWQVKTEQLPTKLMGIDLTKDQLHLLVHGHAIRLNGLTDNQGEPFSATVSVSAASQSLQFTDLNRLDVALRPDNEHRQQVIQNNEGAKTDLTQSRERVVGVPGVSHQQSETIKQLLEMEPPKQENSPKIRR